MKVNSNDIGGFRELTGRELALVSGGDAPPAPGDPNDPRNWNNEFGDGIGFLGIGTAWGFWGADNNGGDGNPDIGSVEVGGVTVTPNPDGTVDISAETELGLLNVNFDLANPEQSTASLTVGSFVGTIDLGSQSASGSYSVDFGGGLSGSISFSASGGGSFTIGATISGTF